MTAVQEPLFAPGWEAEPCGDGEPEPARPRRRRRADLLQTQPVRTSREEYGRSAARPYIVWGRIDTVTVSGRWL